MLIGIVAAIGLSGTGQLAADERKPETASEYAAFEALCNGFPQPSQDLAFRFAGRFECYGYAIGDMELSAVPLEEDGLRRWQLVDRWTSGAGPNRVVWVVNLVLSRDFEFVRGRSREFRGKTVRAYWWKSTGDGIELLHHNNEGGEPTRRLVRHRGPFLPSHAARLLAARLIPSSAVEVPLPQLDLRMPWRNETSVRRAVLRVRADARWQGMKCRQVEMVSDAYGASLALDAEDSSLLGLAEMYAGRTAQVVLPGAPDREPAPRKVLTDPPTTPTAAALQALLCLSYRDESIFERLVHWETLRQQINEKFSDEPVGETELREIGLARYRQRSNTELRWPRRNYESLLRAMAADMHVEYDDESRARVQTPDGVPSRAFAVQRIGARWYLAEIPE